MAWNVEQRHKAAVYITEKLQGKAGAEEVWGIVDAANNFFNYPDEQVRKNYTETVRSDQKNGNGEFISFSVYEIKSAAEAK